MKLNFLGAALFTLLIGTQAHAATDTLGGAIIVRINDGVTPRCINLNKDRITVTVRKVITTKKKNWFTEGKAIGLMMNIGFEGESGGNTQTFALPRAFNSTIESYPGGLISVPVEPNLINKFRLKNGQNIYSGASIDLSLVNITGTTALTDVVLAIVDITKSLPIPANPFTQYLDYAQRYANAIVQKVTTRNEEQDNQTRESVIRMNFSSSDTCQGDQEYTGTKAVVRSATGTEADGIINLNDANNYCYRVVLTPSYTIRFAKTENNACPTDNGKYRNLTNPYVAFFVNAEAEVTALKPETLNKDYSFTSTTMPETASSSYPVVWNYYRAKGYNFSQSSALATMTVKPSPQAAQSQTFYKLEPLVLPVNESIQRCHANGISVEQCLIK
ncbi:MAG: hypothetical protein ACK4FJ_06655 [Ferrovibrio sp.]|uniref:hypothetical protein n=1 Tax=Ferrovibrio sp. TaxID=1917215 RepID=UPI00391A316A